MRRRGEASYTDRAEKYVLAHHGCTAEEVAVEIGQTRVNTYGTLRFIAKSRGTIRSKGGKWVPTKGVTSPRGKGPTVRQAVLDAMADGEPHGTGDLYGIVVKLRPDVGRTTVASEVNRLKQEGVLAVAGAGLRGALYSLQSKGAAEVAAS